MIYQIKKKKKKSLYQLIVKKLHQRNFSASGSDI